MPGEVHQRDLLVPEGAGRGGFGGDLPDVLLHAGVRRAHPAAHHLLANGWAVACAQGRGMTPKGTRRSDMGAHLEPESGLSAVRQPHQKDGIPCIRQWGQLEGREEGLACRFVFAGVAPKEALRIMHPCLYPQ